TLSNLRAIKFLKGGNKPEYGLDPKTNKSVLLIEISIEGEKEPLKLTIGAANAQDKAYYATSSNLKEQIFLVPEDIFKRVLESPAYFSKARQYSFSRRPPGGALPNRRPDGGG